MLRRATNTGPSRRLEIGVYYSVPEEEVELEVNPVFQVQPMYGIGKGVTQVIQANVGARPL